MLTIQNLHTNFHTFSGTVHAVRGIDFSVEPGEIVGIVGESGSGKSVTALSITRLLPDNGSVSEGHILFEGRDLATLSEREMRKVRNSQIAMVFQDPMTSLNPTLTVGLQIAERLRAFDKSLSKADANRRACELLTKVRIPEAEKRIKSYPFELSGGMRQRVMFAIALSMQPKLLIADEPTTALDVTIQSQILYLMKELRDDMGASILLITHDLGVIAETATRVIVMYGGQIMETAGVRELFYETAHPYTLGLKRALPRLTQQDDQRLFAIPGSPPSLLTPPVGCPFAQRCGFAMGVCEREAPPTFSLTPTHQSRCWLHHPECENRAWKEATA